MAEKSKLTLSQLNCANLLIPELAKNLNNAF